MFLFLNRTYFTSALTIIVACLLGATLAIAQEPPAETAPEATPTDSTPSLQERTNDAFGYVVDNILAPVMFYGIGPDNLEVNPGPITINGAALTIDPDAQSFNEVLSAINASDAGVTASYDPETRIVTLTRTDPTDTAPIELGSPADRSNFLAVLRLMNANQIDGSLTSTAAIVPAETDLDLEAGDTPFNPDGPLSKQDFSDGKEYIRSIPLIIIVLVIGGLFYTLRYGFINLRLFRHSLDVIRGRYDKPDHEGEVSHFKALTSALSATVGLGNIAGVALAIAAGGPGAVFWMWLTALFGMSMKFSSCTLALLYRRTHADGRVLGGPMIYLEDGLKEVSPSLAPVGKALAILFAGLCIVASMGGGNLFQTNQTYSVFRSVIFESPEAAPGWLPWVAGILLAIPAGLVIIGGIRRIGEVTSKMVPTMCLFYCGVCLLIVVMNVSQVPALISSIFTSAFSLQALYGGIIGVLVQGMKRAAFSNEAGLGSAAIAHAAAKTDEPVREGVVAMIGPFIDTILVCTMTALAILITDSHTSGAGEGVAITLNAFQQVGTVAPYILFIAVFVFAFSTVIAWGYYGERATEYLFGMKGILAYRIVYVGVIVVGPVLSLSAVVDFADMMLLSMAFPNILGMLLLSGKVKGLVNDYVRRIKSGEMKPQW
jgi:AGCS family alanine or glycine:cation symporter